MIYTNYFGIDVSKKTLDIMDQKGNHTIVSNDLEGFKKLANLVQPESLCIMEATGIYHIQLATFLHSKSMHVSVVNPLQIKRFIQMKMKRGKTDKADAEMICLYGQTQQVELWSPSSPELSECKDAYQTMEQYINTRSSFKNKLEELKTKKSAQYLIESVEKQIVAMTDAVTELEVRINKLIKKEHAVLLSNLKSISGIGERTATLLIISSDGFKHFDSAKQLASFYGIAPSEKMSGTSIKAKSSISKMGNPLVRKKMYMCSLQAS